MPKREAVALGIAAVALTVVLPVCNLLPASSPLAVSNFTLNLFGKFLTYAILALGLDLLWGYAGVLSLGHGVFFGLGAYAMGMHLMLEIGSKSVYQSALPDFMVWNQVTALPLFWKPFHSGAFTLLAIVLVPGLFGLAFGYLAFRSRIRGVYFSIITQALALSAWLVFNRNEMNLGGTNGLADFKTAFGFPLNHVGTQRALYVVTAVTLVAAYLLCRWITLTRAGKVLVAIRDSETRVLFSGYSPAAYKLFVFVVSAVLAGVAGALYAPQVGIITPAKIGVLPSIEMVVWVAAGGRGTLYGAVLGAFGVNWIQSWLTTSYPDFWLLFLGGLFMGAVLFFPDGVVGALGRLTARARRLLTRTGEPGSPGDRPRVALDSSRARRPGVLDRASGAGPQLSQATLGVMRPPSSEQ
ncbi:MAG: urea ABC transporter permease subunit UrtC [Candidatus Rokuibacteriota bacterium]|nr:MAG: urea ABC transporter permease subunit UrtC [Candidatus Rokubacteria bacterium]